MTRTMKCLLMSALVLAVSACSKDEPEVDTTPVTLESEVAGVIGGTEADLAARAGNTVYFEYDKYSLTSEATKTLKKQAAWLKLYPSVNVIVEGHCDDRGTRKYNQALGERRANAAKRYLVAQGVSAKRITTVSYGKDRPAELGSTEAAYAKNRRDVTILAK
ncbi:MAG: peptidoglycan-associated lipoprotein Pal [Rickettsiales bacterium]|nr:peptidoglycan-associated lipoprotein Pal [Rickettsiales bacterium]